MLPTTLLALAALTTVPQQAPQQEDTTRVRGRVVDMRGEGVPAARIQVSDWLAPDKVLNQTVTDGEGYFLSGKVKRRRGFQVHCSADDRCNAIVYATPERVAKVVVQDAVVVTGTVHDRAGKPIANALVRASYEGRDLFDTVCDGRTDKDGKFSLNEVALGYNRFSTWIDGVGLAEVRRTIRGPCEVALAPNNEPTVSMAIEVTGLPDDFAGSIPISLLPYDNGSLMRLPPPMRKLTTSGSWRADCLPNWKYTVSLRHPDFTFEPRRVNLKPGENPHNLRFATRGLKTHSQGYTAFIVGPDEKPLPNVTLRLSRRNGMDPTDARSDAAGKLTWNTTLRANTKVRIRPRDEDWVAASIDPGNPVQSFLTNANTRDRWTLAPSERLVVHLDKACLVTGRILLADGRPAGMLAVRLEYSREGQWPEWQAYAHTSTDRDGSFRFGQLQATEDPVRLAADTSAGSVMGKPFHLKSTGTRVQLPEAKLSAPAIIEGVVLDAHKQPMPGVTIWMREWDMQTNLIKNGNVTEVVSDRLGRYRFVGVPIGGAALQLVREGSSPGMKLAGDAFAIAEGKTYTRDLIGTGY